jgi:hypothetical protein
MCGIEAQPKVHSFFVMDENFLLHRTRAMRLLERMKQAGKSWELSVFAAAAHFSVVVKMHLRSAHALSEER